MEPGSKLLISAKGLINAANIELKSNSVLTVDGGALCDAEFTFSPYSTLNVKNMGVIKCKKGYTFQMPYHAEMNVVTGSIQ